MSLRGFGRPSTPVSFVGEATLLAVPDVRERKTDYEEDCTCASGWCFQR